MAVKPGDILAAFKAAVEKVLSSANQDKIAKEMADTVRIRTQLGSGVESSGAKKSPLKPLAASTKAWRAGKVAFRKSKQGHVYPIENPDEKPFLSDKTTPNKSNLTRTGQLIESITGTGKQSGFTIDATGTRKGISGEGDKVTLTNKQVADFVKEGGRPFLNLSNVEIKKIERLIETQLIEEIEKKLGK